MIAHIPEHFHKNPGSGIDALNMPDRSLDGSVTRPGLCDNMYHAAIRAGPIPALNTTGGCCVIPKGFTAVVLGVLLVGAQPAHATGNDCTIAFNPKTSGFMLNPILDKLTVSSARPKTPKDVCVLEVGDEILNVNQQPVVGARALAVQKYWKSLDPKAPIVFRVKRSGSVLMLTSR